MHPAKSRTEQMAALPGCKALFQQSALDDVTVLPCGRAAAERSRAESLAPALWHVQLQQRICEARQPASLARAATAPMQAQHCMHSFEGFPGRTAARGPGVGPAESVLSTLRFCDRGNFGQICNRITALRTWSKTWGGASHGRSVDAVSVGPCSCQAICEPSGWPCAVVISLLTWTCL